MFSAEQIVELASNLKSLIAPACRERGLSFAQFLIISNIPVSGISLKKLAVFVGSETSTMSRNIDKLNSSGFVVKAGDLLDKRKIIITRTTKAIEANVAINQDVQNIITALNFQNIDDGKTGLLKDALESFSWLCYKYLNEK